MSGFQPQALWVVPTRSWWCPVRGLRGSMWWWRCLRARALPAPQEARHCGGSCQMVGFNWAEYVDFCWVFTVGNHLGGFDSGRIMERLEQT